MSFALLRAAVAAFRVLRSYAQTGCGFALVAKRASIVLLAAALAAVLPSLLWSPQASAQTTAAPTCKTPAVIAKMKELRARIARYEQRVINQELEVDRLQERVRQAEIAAEKVTGGPGTQAYIHAAGELRNARDSLYAAKERLAELQGIVANLNKQYDRLDALPPCEVPSANPPLSGFRYLGLNESLGFTGIAAVGGYNEFLKLTGLRTSTGSAPSLDPFANFQVNYLFPIAALPGGATFVGGPYGSLYLGNQTTAVNFAGGSSISTRTNVILAGGGEFGAALPQGPLVYTLIGIAGASETNSIQFAPGITSASTVVPGIEVGGGIQFPVWQVPGLSFFGQWVYQQYASPRVDGGVASPPYDYTFPRYDNKFTVGLSANSTLFSDLPFKLWRRE